MISIDNERAKIFERLLASAFVQFNAKKYATETVFDVDGMRIEAVCRAYEKVNSIGCYLHYLDGMCMRDFVNELNEIAKLETEEANFCRWYIETFDVYKDQNECTYCLIGNISILEAYALFKKSTHVFNNTFIIEDEHGEYVKEVRYDE